MTEEWDTKVKEIILMQFGTPPTESTALITKLTLGCPSSQGTVVINDMVEGKGQDEEGAVTGSVHLKGNISLIQTNRLPFLGQRRLEQFSSHLIGILCTCCFSSTGSQFDKFLIHTNLWPLNLFLLSSSYKYGVCYGCHCGLGFWHINVTVQVCLQEWWILKMVCPDWMIIWRQGIRQHSWGWQSIHPRFYPQPAGVATCPVLFCESRRK